MLVGMCVCGKGDNSFKSTVLLVCEIAERGVDCRIQSHLLFLAFFLCCLGVIVECCFMRNTKPFLMKTTYRFRLVSVDHQSAT